MKPFHLPLLLSPTHYKMMKPKTMKKKKTKKEQNDSPSPPGLHHCQASRDSTIAVTATPEPIKKKKQKMVKQGTVSAKGESRDGGAKQNSKFQSVPVARTLFTEHDEITILKSMVEFSKFVNVPLPLPTWRDFYPFLKGKLSADFTNTQIYRKIRGLRTRFLSRSKCGEEPILSGDHDVQVYIMCKQIWGTAVSSTHDDSHDEGDEAQGFWSKYPLLIESLEWDNTFSFSKIDTVKENLHLIGSAKASEMEMEWMELKSKEHEIHSKKVNFKMELMRSVLNAMKDEGIGSSSSAAPM